MKLFLMIMITSYAWATTYELKETSQRFKMRVEKNELVYRSETVSKTFSIRPCNKTLLADFYSSWLKRMPSGLYTKGVPFLVNGKEFPLDPKGEFFLQLSTLDATILTLVYSEDKACS